MDRRKITAIVLFIILIAVLSVGYACSPLKAKISQMLFATPVYTLLTGDEVMGLRQVITSDSKTSRTVMWQSFSDRDDFVLEYGTDENGELTSVQPQKSELDADGKRLYVYSAELAQLEPGTVYSWRVGYGKSRTDWHTLTTEAENSSDFKALIFPDSQSNDYTDWEKLANLAWDSNPDADFFINLGDLVDNGYDLAQWDSWFGSVEPMAEKIPAAPIQGNHETYTTDWKVAMPTPYLTLFDLPANGEDKYKNQYYSYDYGDVHFTVINTQDDEMHEFQPDMMAAQLKWLENDLASTDKKWKVVLMHRDVLVYGRDARPLGDGEIAFSPQGELFMPIFDKYNVDAVMTAHLHTYRRRVQLKNFKPDENGTLYILSGVAGNVRYPNLWHRNPLDAYVAPQPETDNYIVLDASEDKLTFSAYLPDNTMMDTVTLTK